MRIYTLKGFESVLAGSVQVSIGTGGPGSQALVITVVLYIIGFWMFRHWLRSTPRVTPPRKAPAPSLLASIPEADLSGEVAELRAEVARLRAEKMN